MSKILEVLNRKSVELKSEVVEFNIVAKADSYMKQAEIDESKAIAKLKQAVDLFKEADAKTKKGKEVAEKGLKIAKELGVPVKGLQESYDTAGRMEANHKRWISTISTMK